MVLGSKFSLQSPCLLSRSVMPPRAALTLFAAVSWEHLQHLARSSWSFETSVTCFLVTHAVAWIGPRVSPLWSHLYFPLDSWGPGPWEEPRGARGRLWPPGPHLPEPPFQLKRSPVPRAFFQLQIHLRTVTRPNIRSLLGRILGHGQIVPQQLKIEVRLTNNCVTNVSVHTFP